MNSNQHNHSPGLPATLESFIGLLPNPCALIAADGTLRAINAAWQDALFNPGLGEDVVSFCARTFHWPRGEWDPIAQGLGDLLAGTTTSCTFEGLAAEPPERWFSNSLVAHPQLEGGLLWQIYDVSEWRLAEHETARIWQQIRAALDSISDGFALYDIDDRLVFCNKSYRHQHLKNVDMLVPGQSYAEILRSGVRREQYPDALGREEDWIAERLRQHHSGEATEIQLADDRWLRSVDQRTQDGGIVCIRTDISYIKRAEALREQSEQQAEFIRFQESLLAELSTPLLRISERVLVMPLIGALDSARAALVVDSLLHAVEQQRVAVTILDITGVPVVDTQIANLLLQCAQAVRLLGASMVLTGIRPDVAQTMVALGIDLEGVVTRADLMGGIAYALRRR